jgi:hypothetical protein
MARSSDCVRLAARVVIGLDEALGRRPPGSKETDFSLWQTLSAVMLCDLFRRES